MFGYEKFAKKVGHLRPRKKRIKSTFLGSKFHMFTICSLKNAARTRDAQNFCTAYVYDLEQVTYLINNQLMPNTLRRRDSPRQLSRVGVGAVCGPNQRSLSWH